MQQLSKMERFIFFVKTVAIIFILPAILIQLFTPDKNLLWITGAMTFFVVLVNIGKYLTSWIDQFISVYIYKIMSRFIIWEIIVLALISMYYAYIIKSTDTSDAGFYILVLTFGGIIVIEIITYFIAIIIKNPKIESIIFKVMKIKKRYDKKIARYDNTKANLYQKMEDARDKQLDYISKITTPANINIQNTSRKLRDYYNLR